jgi:hypothetical protein
MSRVKQIRGKPTRERGNVIARIFKGGAKQGNRPGPDLDHFRVEWEDSPSVNKQWADECWHRLFGDKPDTLRNVQFLTDNAESALESINEKWGMSGKGIPICTRRCDGEYINYEFTGQAASREIKPCDFPACGCAFTYRLRFWLPDFTRMSGILGEFLLTGHSREDYERIQPAIDNMAGVGALRRVAFTLYRKPVRVVQPNGIPVTKSIVHLDLMEAGAQQMAIAAGDAAISLPALPEPIKPPPDDTEDDAALGPSTYVVAVERRQQGQNSRYIIDTESGHKITIFTRELFREAGHDVENWKDIKGRQEIDPIAITENWDGQHWQLVSVSPASPADAIPL